MPPRVSCALHEPACPSEAPLGAGAQALGAEPRRPPPPPSPPATPATSASPAGPLPQPRGSASLRPRRPRRPLLLSLQRPRTRAPLARPAWTPGWPVQHGGFRGRRGGGVRRAPRPPARPRSSCGTRPAARWHPRRTPCAWAATTATRGRRWGWATRTSPAAPRPLAAALLVKRWTCTGLALGGAQPWAHLRVCQLFQGHMLVYIDNEANSDSRRQVHLRAEV